MNENHNKKLTGVSKTLRKNMTPQERKLWYGFLKELPVTVNRQKVIGEYIVDFYIASSALAVELDGSQHYGPDGEAGDKSREEYLNERGVSVVRYSNRDITENFSGVCEDILNRMNQKSDDIKEFT